jgi:hypothetical protein
MIDVKTGQRWEYRYIISGTNINELFIVEVLYAIDRVRVVQVISSRNWKIGDEFNHSISAQEYWRYLSGQDVS